MQFTDLLQWNDRSAYKPSIPHAFNSIDIKIHDVSELLDNINQINYTRSHTTSAIKDKIDVEQNYPSFQSQQEQDIINEIKEQPKIMNLNKTKNNSTLCLNKLNNVQIGIEQSIKIYYFNLDLFRMIAYDEKTTVQQLIIKSLEVYSQEQHLDQKKISSRNPMNYQMRLTIQQKSHIADMCLIEPLNYKRLIHETLFECLVLVKKSIDNSQKDCQQIANNQNVSIILKSDEDQNQISQLVVQANDKLWKVCQFVEYNQLNCNRTYNLAYSSTEEGIISNDTLIKNLQSLILYVRFPVYMDEAEEQNHARKIRTSIYCANENNIIDILPPIGITQASKYEEYEVIKYNKMGMSQKRIIGIDQMKIYNYKKQVRKNNKQVGFFSQIFGINVETGTKIPFRLIKDIISLKKNELGFTIQFIQKSITYSVSNKKKLNEIIRKLDFLIKYDKK